MRQDIIEIFLLIIKVILDIISYKKVLIIHSTAHLIYKLSD